jgi:DNA-binding NtrC family response regulator
MTREPDLTERDATRSRDRVMQRTRLRVTAGPDAGLTLECDGDEVTLGTARGNDLTLTDTLVSRYHATLRRTIDGIELLDVGSTNGTFVGGVRLGRGSVFVPSGAALTLGKTTVVVEEGETRVTASPALPPLPGVIGASPATLALVEQVHGLSRSEVAVLLLGESGTGKEVLARAIHASSPRASGPFEVIDCGALSSTLFASELFGHERGAFTGADRKHVGAFERANGGTLLLDELGELPMDQQVALLGAIERRRIRRVGGSTEIPIDVRILAATHRDLRAAVNANRFRLDLYYRLAVVMLRLPPLRERPGDVAALVEHFLAQEEATGEVRALVSPAVLQRLERHDWPGNVRELRNVIAALVATGKVPTLVEGEAPAKEAVWDPNAKTSFAEAKAEAVTAFEKRFLADLLARSEGNYRKAARIAEMDRSHLLALLRKHGYR